MSDTRKNEFLDAIDIAFEGAQKYLDSRVGMTGIARYLATNDVQELIDSKEIAHVDTDQFEKLVTTSARIYLKTSSKDQLVQTFINEANIIWDGALMKLPKGGFAIPASSGLDIMLGERLSHLKSSKEKEEAPLIPNGSAKELQDAGKALVDEIKTKQAGETIEIGELKATVKGPSSSAKFLQFDTQDPQLMDIGNSINSILSKKFALEYEMRLRARQANEKSNNPFMG